MITTPIRLRNRIGKFRVSWPILRELLEGQRPDDVASWNALMQGLVITRAENCFAADEVLYVGMHPMFAEVPEGAVIPTYEGVITRKVEEHGITTFTCEWRKVP